jgi:hypothetical protein
VTFPASAHRDGEDVLILLDGETSRLQVAGVELRASPDSAVAAGLLPAMARGTPLAVEGRVSPVLLSNVSRIQEILVGWRSGFRRVQVLADPASPWSGPPARAAAMFSGGVDSLYTVVRHRQELGALVFVHGVSEVPASGMAHDDAARRARQTAERLELPFLEASTDLRRTLQAHLPRKFTLGALLAAIGHALASAYSGLLIPGSPWPADDPYGTHPLLDPLWSSDRMEVRRIGSDTTRPEKVAVVAEHPELLEQLQVCPRPGTGLNCGRCSKCVCTLLCLHLAGIARPPSFPHPAGTEDVEALRPTTFFIHMWEETLEALEADQAPDDLLRAVRRYVAAVGRNRGWWGRVRRAGALAARAVGRRDRPPAVRSRR